MCSRTCSTRQLGPDAHVVRRHEPADAALGIAEQRHRDRPLLRREQVQELARHRRGQLVEERGAVVGRHLVQDLRHLLGGHGLDQALLRLEREILEDVGGEVAREQPEGDHLLLHRQGLDQARGGRWRPVLEHLVERREVPRADDAREIGRRAHGHPRFVLALVVLAHRSAWTRPGHLTTGMCVRQVGVTRSIQHPRQVLHRF